MINMPEYVNEKLIVLLKDNADSGRKSALLKSYRYTELSEGLLYFLDVLVGEEDSQLNYIQQNFSDILSASSRPVKK